MNRRSLIELRVGFGRRSLVVAIAAALLVATAALEPTTTGASATSVVATARVAPAFSLTLLTSGEVDFGEVLPGSTYELASATRLEIRSNRPWDFIDSSDNVLWVGDNALVRETFMRHAPSLPFESGHTPGVHLITCDYVLDLTSTEAYDLPTDVTLLATFTYTAVQQ